MLNSHVKFHSANGKRLILIADDEIINREMMGNLLQDEYELIFAVDGIDALNKIREYRETLSLVLLDIMMPGMSGLEVLSIIKKDRELSGIPVIVITSDQEAEVESLSLGAIDFIPKPYPQADVIMARIRRVIELSEDRDIINSTERDPLTGLYNREYFYRYAEQFDQYHKDTDMDAIIVDVNHFHMINERFGTAYGDEVLRRIGERVREMVLDIGGIVCRREADTFMVYCPHGKDYQAILDNASVGLSGDNSVNNRVRLRMGVYEFADKSLDIERRFDRAKIAADTVRNSFVRTIGKYNSTLHEKELYNEQLLDNFHEAIEKEEFLIYYQPKFDITPDIPVLASAEALVRWKHPELGMISPGVFIPLFEENGLIQTLDNYVWKHAAAQIRDWRDRLGFAVPVSVNVSRIDMYDPEMITTLLNIINEYGLVPHDMLLEITESAYTQDSDQIIDTVNKLRALGFRIEMDDFGTGYSSLNMISELPIDALKLDMQFIRNAFQEGKDTRMLEVIIDIADYLGVPVIAEGVETEEQLLALKSMGCDIVQGYYFSKPVPADEYEQYVTARRDLPADSYEPGFARDGAAGKSFNRIVHALSSGFSRIYYADSESGHYVEFTSEGSYKDLQISKSGMDFFHDMQAALLKNVHPEDKVRVAMAIHKDALLSHVRTGRPYSFSFRKVEGSEISTWRFKAAMAEIHDDHHIVAGLSCLNDAPEGELAAGSAILDELTFGGLARALSSDIENLYIIDADDDRFLGYKAEKEFDRMELEMSGADFFEECRRKIPTAIYCDDCDRVASALDKNALIKALEKRNAVSMLYRLMLDGNAVYYRLKAVWADPGTRKHIVIGVGNADELVRSEMDMMPYDPDPEPVRGKEAAAI